MMIDIIKIKELIQNGKLEVYTYRGHIYLRDVENDETVFIGNVESEE